jgi:hypothetical protein
MNSNALLELARERTRDLIDDARRSRRHLGRREDRNLPASELLFILGNSARDIDARVHAAQRLRVTLGTTDRL